MKKLLVIGGLLLVLLLLSFRPVNTSKDNSVTVFGVVDAVSEAGYKDAVFKLAGQKQLYYVNRGLVSRFTLVQLKELEGQKVTIMYAKHWSLLGLFFNPSWHITELRSGAKVLYSEFGR